MLKKILIAAVALIAVLVIVIATRPGDFRVTRSAKVSAPPAAVFPHVNDLAKWNAWSPWVKIDPQMKVTQEGPASGTGAISRWAGNSNVGEGSMTIVESRPNELVRFRLDFLKPMAGTCDAEFTFAPQGNDTLVTWSMTGKNNFIAKAISLFMDCDKMVGGQFEQGLAEMKSVVERGAKPAAQLSGAR